MKCKYCGKIFRTSAEDRLRNINYGDFSPRYWQNEYHLEDQEVEDLGFDPQDDSSFICYDCDEKMYNLSRDKAEKELAKMRDENGHYVLRLGNKFMGEDCKFKAKVGNKYLKNKKLVSKGGEEFECREEPTQVINQMKKDGKIDKNAKVKIQKIKESESNQFIEAIEKAFNDEKIYPDELHSYEDEFGVLQVEFELTGDWKHEHLRAKNLMDCLGWTLSEEVLIDDSCDDFYTTRYTFTDIDSARKYVDANAEVSNWPEEM